MSDFLELKSQVCDYLSTLETFAGVRVVGAFPVAKREIPLNKPVAAVSVAAAELSPAGFGGYLGGDDNQIGEAASITMEFLLLAPEADFCSELFESLCAALLCGGFGFWAVTAEAAGYDPQAAAFSLRARAKLKAFVNRREQPERVFRRTEIRKA